MSVCPVQTERCLATLGFQLAPRYDRCICYGRPAREPQGSLRRSWMFRACASKVPALYRGYKLGAISLRPLSSQGGSRGVCCRFTDPRMLLFPPLVKDKNNRITIVVITPLRCRAYIHKHRYDIFLRQSLIISLYFVFI